MGLDARARYTKQVIQEAFLALLRDKPVTKITVTELCLRAQINRATFYKHYQDVPDLMEAMESRIFDNLQEALDVPGMPDLEGFLLGVFRYIRSHGEKYMVLGSANGDPNLAMKTFLLCYEKAYPLLERNLPNMPDNRRKMMYHFLSQGCGGIMAHWLREGMEESPEEIAGFILDVCTQIVR